MRGRSLAAAPELRDCKEAIRNALPAGHTRHARQRGYRNRRLGLLAWSNYFRRTGWLRVRNRYSGAHFQYHHSVGVVERFSNEAPGHPAVRGFLHRPDAETSGALVLAHGAGSNCSAPLLVAVANAFAGSGLAVLRCDLPFRQARPHGPPAGNGALDRAGLRRAVEVLREIVPEPVYLGGHSYGGRQGSMLAAEDPALVNALLLLSYPLHPPEKPQQLRTAHFPKLCAPALFVSGCRDPFGSLDEMQTAVRLISAPTELLTIEGAGHDLARGGYDEVARRALAAFMRLAGLRMMRQDPPA